MYAPCDNRAQTNLEKPGKPGKIYLFVKTQGKSGKIREKLDFWKKIRENSGKFFSENLPFENLKI